MNTDVLAEIISFLDITEDKQVLTSCKQIFNLTDNEKDQILRTWENNSKYEYRVFGDAKYWLVNDKIHRDYDKPAVERSNGDKEWFVNGQRHRDADRPAFEDVDGYKAWYVNGKRHRDNDLSAIEYSDGSKEWYVNGQRYRYNDLPTTEYVDSRKY